MDWRKKGVLERVCRRKATGFNSHSTSRQIDDDRSESEASTYH